MKINVLIAEHSSVIPEFKSILREISEFTDVEFCFIEAGTPIQAINKLNWCDMVVIDFWSELCDVTQIAIAMGKLTLVTGMLTYRDPTLSLYLDEKSPRVRVFEKPEYPRHQISEAVSHFISLIHQERQSLISN